MEQKQSPCKIYSRNRIKIFKHRSVRNISHRDYYKGLYIIILIIAFVTCIVIYRIIDPIFEAICSDKALSIATKITNDESTKALEGYKYNDMFTIERDESGNIQMINANILAIDIITSNIAAWIQEDLDSTEKVDIKLSLGSFTGIKMLSGIGPNMRFKISSSGNVSTDLKSEFIAQGINQTLHRIYLQIDCKVNILTPVKTIQKNIYNQVLLAENIIVGQIPSTYYNLDNMEKIQDTLETIK